jgi:uncharacterized protein (DUF1697 family)
LARDKHVALLRGINVGKSKRIAMADLAELVRGLGYADVRTLLNSGNVVFEVPPAKSKLDHAQRIETALAAELGVSARVTTLSPAEVTMVVEENPLLEVARDPSRLLVVVWRSKNDRKLLVPLAAAARKPEVFALGKRAGYLWCAKGILESTLADALLGRDYKETVTTRNWSTFSKLHALSRAHS